MSNRSLGRCPAIGRWNALVALIMRLQATERLAFEGELRNGHLINKPRSRPPRSQTRTKISTARVRSSSLPRHLGPVRINWKQSDSFDSSKSQPRTWCRPRALSLVVPKVEVATWRTIEIENGERGEFVHKLAQHIHFGCNPALGRVLRALIYTRAPSHNRPE